MNDGISVILPSRGRSAELRRAVEPLVGQAEVIVGLDDDDPTLLESLAALAGLDAKIVVSPRHRTVAELCNTLAAEATGGWLLMYGDDYVPEQDRWSDCLRETLAMLPGRMGVAHPVDHIYPGFSTLPVVSREMVALNGFFAAPFFPFLFIDTWWNEIGDLIGVKLSGAFSVRLDSGAGNQHRYSDLPVWADLFERTRPMRVEVAIKALWKIFGEGSEQGSHLVATMPHRVKACEEFQAHMRDPAWLARWNDTGHSSPRYRELHDKACAFLAA